MNSNLNRHIQEILLAKHRTRVWNRIVALMAAAVVLFTSMQLSSPADAVTQDNSPIIEEHYSDIVGMDAASDSAASDLTAALSVPTSMADQPTDSIVAEEKLNSEEELDPEEKLNPEEGPVSFDELTTDGELITDEVLTIDEGGIADTEQNADNEQNPDDEVIYEETLSESELSVEAPVTGIRTVELALATITPVDGSCLPADISAGAYVEEGSAAEAAVAEVEAFKAGDGMEYSNTAAVSPAAALKSTRRVSAAPAANAGRNRYQVFDISLGIEEEAQREYEGGFYVSVTLPEAITGRGFRLYHLHEGSVEEITDLTLDCIDSEAAGEYGSEQMLSGFSFVTECFSQFVLSYTVDFEYVINGRTYQFSMNGGESILLSDLAEILGLLDGIPDFVLVVELTVLKVVVEVVLKIIQILGGQEAIHRIDNSGNRGNNSDDRQNHDDEILFSDLFLLHTNHFTQQIFHMHLPLLYGFQACPGMTYASSIIA